MSSDETFFEPPEPKKTDSKRASFVSALKENTIVLNRSISSSMIAAKDKAWNSIKGKYELSIGEAVTVEQLKRILNNLKTEIKKKIDKNSTGNKRVTLSEWEKDFVNILDKFESPNFKQVPGALRVGNGSLNKMIEASNPTTSRTLTSTESNESLKVNPNSSFTFTKTNDDNEKIIKKRKLRAYETQESIPLSTNELQRLVLIEQLDLIRMQKKREELEMKKLEYELSNSKKNKEDIFNYDLDLTEYAVLND